MLNGSYIKVKLTCYPNLQCFYYSIKLKSFYTLPFEAKENYKFVYCSFNMAKIKP